MLGSAAHRRQQTPFLFLGLAGELLPDRTNANKHRCHSHAVPNGFRYSTTKIRIIGKVVGGVPARAPKFLSRAVIYLIFNVNGYL